MQVGKARTGTLITAEEVEVVLLGQAVEQLLLLVGETEDPGEAADPLAAMIGLSLAGKPSDPALVRLLPDAYPDDDEQAAEFRRYTEADLRAGKRAHAGVVLATLVPGEFVLDRDQVDAWLGTVNDLRLVLGTRLHVRQDTEPVLDEDDPAQASLALYHWLGWLQEAILGVISPRQ